MEANPRAVRSAAIALVLAGAILWVPILDLMFSRDGGFLGDLGFRSGPSGTPLGWALALLVAGIYAGYTIRNVPLVRAHWLRFSPFKLLGIFVAVGAAVVEEAFFRRLLMDWIFVRGGSAVAQILASGLIFGLAHGAWGVVTRRMWVGLRVMVATGALGLALAAVYVISGRSLAPVIVSHFLITGSIQPGIMIAAFSGEMRRQPAVG